MKEFEQMEGKDIFRVAGSWVGADPEAANKEKEEKQKELDQAQDQVDQALRELEGKVRAAQEAVNKAQAGLRESQTEPSTSLNAAPTREVSSELDWMLQFEEGQAEIDRSRQESEASVPDLERAEAQEEASLARVSELEEVTEEAEVLAPAEDVTEEVAEESIQEAVAQEEASQPISRSRRRRHQEEARERQEDESESREVKAPFAVTLPLVFSLILAALSVANPFLTFLATNEQTQILYSAWAQNQGQAIYGDIYSSSGLLYHLLLWLGQMTYGGLPLLALAFFFHFLSGMSFYRLVYGIKGKKSLAQASLLLYYFLLFLLGFGGLYAASFALWPVLMVLGRLQRYFKGYGKDEGFLLIGAGLALAFLLHPLSAFVLAVSSFLAVTVFNLAQKRWSQGLYQLLASLFGFAVVFYPVGYYVVWNQTFSLALDQILYPLTSLNLHSHMLENGLLYGLGLLGLGFLPALLLAGFAQKKMLAWPMMTLALLGFLDSLFLAFFNGDQGLYQLLPILPYGLLLLLAWLAPQVDEEEGLWGTYMRKSFYLPLFLAVYIIGFPILDAFVISRGDHADRRAAAAYIQSKTKSGDQIYAWDDDASLYKASGRLSAASLLSPSLYGQTSSNRLALDRQLKNQRPSYILVNLSVPLSKDVKALLESDYQAVMLDLDQFTLYERK